MNGPRLTWSGLYLGPEYGALAPGRPEGPPSSLCTLCDARDHEAHDCPEMSGK